MVLNVYLGITVTRLRKQSRVLQRRQLPNSCAYTTLHSMMQIIGPPIMLLFYAPLKGKVIKP